MGGRGQRTQQRSSVVAASFCTSGPGRGTSPAPGHRQVCKLQTEEENKANTQWRAAPSPAAHRPRKERERENPERYHS